MSKRLLKTFEEDNNLNNVLVPLSIDVDEVIYLYHHDVSQRKINNCSKVLNKYKKLKVLYKKVKEEEVEKYITEDTVVDISASKYLSIVLYEEAIKNDLKVIYYDEEERVVKEYNNHKVYGDKMFSLKIEDIVTLGGGRIISMMHKPVQDRRTIDMIYKAVDQAGSQYNLFTAYVSRVNSFLADYENDRNSYHLSDNVVRKIVTDEQYIRYKDLNLFEINGNDLKFVNGDIRRIFMVTGAFLENYIYHKLSESNYFDDVMMSSTIEFNDEKWKYPVSCEIDCLVLKDNNLLFVSIKSNKVEKDDLNEIKVHNVVFGNRQSSPVICINSDLSNKKPSIYAKAEELGVYVIDSSSFQRGEMVDKFISIMEGTYEYEKI
ncbi:MAG: hypothetical protein IJJ00_08505 [Erysipelotrichaceae bacterium]|nr:hypothetical protein [Erysipelotrichaceae bacterium]